LAFKGHKAFVEGRYDDAISNYTKAESWPPTLRVALYERGLILYQQLNAPKKGLADIQKAAKLGHLPAIETLKMLQ
jgi:tetratricopeptide (TPR) repeat protein